MDEHENLRWICVCARKEKEQHVSSGTVKRKKRKVTDILISELEVD